jgi:hypothetical protein
MMKQLFSVSRLGLIILPGFLVLASGYALAQQPAATSTKPMGGCGMMVDGKMVHKDTAGKPCMDMNKPASSMPNGVTMHSDPAAATKPKK